MSHPHFKIAMAFTGVLSKILTLNKLLDSHPFK